MREIYPRDKKINIKKVTDKMERFQKSALLQLQVSVSLVLPIYCLLNSFAVFTIQWPEKTITQGHVRASFSRLNLLKEKLLKVRIS